MKNLFRKIKLVTLVGGGLILTLAGCKLDDNDSPTAPATAYVSLYNASPNSPGLNIMVDRRVINNNSFDYADHTGYLRFYTGDRLLEFGPYGANNVIADTTVNFQVDKAYSVFIVDSYQKQDVLVLNDDTAQPGTGKAKVRFLNLSPDAPGVDLAVAGNDTALFKDQSFKQTSEFIEIDAKAYDFQVKAGSGNNELLLSLPDINLQEGWIYTVLVRGYRTPPGGSSAVLSAEVIVD
ncbi:MAG TPA: DUF4397 domain-containing protein [Cyclobacteriaceae bacterium]|nr:DUF4397 domain-containing protein [Cyclobacteriaceae bacterium]